MVAVIKTGHSIRRIFQYNENKVKQGLAECIGAINYPIDAQKMTDTMKLNRLLNQAKLNERVTRNSVHISLNFDPKEKSLDRESLMEIAESYMTKIGFGDQPFLVYRHDDAGHPHIHLISVKVRPDGSRIDMQNIGRNQSEKARTEIEKSFGLTVAGESKRQERFRLRPVDVQKVQYGCIDTRWAITNVLNAVLEKYRYSSLPELNAILKQYNVLADRGSERSRVFKFEGLLYRIIDESGKPIGVPIKASSFYNAPTLKFLKVRFEENRSKKVLYKLRTKSTIDHVLKKKPANLDDFCKFLEKHGIHGAIRKNENGNIYGITYVDHITKCVFNGSDLGKLYSVKGIQERCITKLELDQIVTPPLKPSAWKDQRSQLTGFNVSESPVDQLRSEKNNDIIYSLIQPEQVYGNVPHQLKNKPRKRKRRAIKQI
ncbi:relaxase/mobilization nuclease domain-containing protein [Sphingobacterium endophyticum]|uniref:relaxase/mobilization nuclease domain-containing protein n=1 Tax=Sphingobacterium endophyticum TaxID=2546448 RepID=UPI0012E27438|nr:relaxase/mobilization nuclease domain-containing protein [Sphingobacterium endophyticum]